VAEMRDYDWQKTKAVKYTTTFIERIGIISLCLVRSSAFYSSRDHNGAVGYANRAWIVAVHG